MQAALIVQNTLRHMISAMPQQVKQGAKNVSGRNAQRAIVYQNETRRYLKVVGEMLKYFILRHSVERPMPSSRAISVTRP